MYLLKHPNKTLQLSNNQCVIIYFPTQNLLSDAECKICKYKSLIISVYSSNYGGQILCRETEEGRKIYKNLQMNLPSKMKYTNICKDVFPVFCIFTFVNADFCRFLQLLCGEIGAFPPSLGRRNPPIQS